MSGFFEGLSFEIFPKKKFTGSLSGMVLIGDSAHKMESKVKNSPRNWVERRKVVDLNFIVPRT